MDRQQMLQEIQEAILKKIYPDLNVFEAIFKYWCVNEVKYSDEWWWVCVFSLSRVISALDDAYWYNDEYWCIFWIDMRYERYTICERKLLNEDNSDCMLDDQSEETIEALHKLLVRK